MIKYEVQKYEKSVKAQKGIKICDFVIDCGKKLGQHIQIQREMSCIKNEK
jgi:hypothetical protein